MLNRPVPMPMTRSPLDEPRQIERDVHVTPTEVTTEHNINIDQHKLKIDQQKPKTDQQKINIDQLKKLKKDQQKLKIDQHKLPTDQQKINIEQKIDEDSSGSLDDIEMKMNELHGIPFVERPPHELPKVVHKTYSKTNKDADQSKGTKKLNLPATSKQNCSKMAPENIIDLESDEEAIEHEPITGDIDVSKKAVPKLPAPVKTHISEYKQLCKELQPKESFITENDFDKFARRNSITYENCLAVKFDGKEAANVVQTVKQKNATKSFSKNEMIHMEPRTKLPHKQSTSQMHMNNFPNTKFSTVPEDPNTKNYQTKIHSAYQSALTTKRHLDHPITIIEDKPVKVVFMETNTEFIPKQLNVQGKELSPAKKATVESAKVSPHTLNPEGTDTVNVKQQEDKSKTKHQRKQVLTPVEAPELELIQPQELGIDVSPKKKRKTEDIKIEKSPKNLVHKKSYLLGRAANDEKNITQIVANPIKETKNHTEIVIERTVSAIDNLVKAAELLENQSIQSTSPKPDSQPNSPVKRGRGRPRKYPLPEGATENKVASPSPQKKPRLIDAKPIKQDSLSEADSSDEEQMIRENWTMGKINENIVCPICYKLFRSENVVFKHVKHCTGVSPTRSDLEKRSPRRRRYSRDSDNKSFDSQSEDMELDEKLKESDSPNKRKSKESISKTDMVDIILIEDTPTKEQKSENKLVKRKSTEEKHELNPSVESSIQGKDDIQEIPKKELTLKDMADEKLAERKKLDQVSETKARKVDEAVDEKIAKSKTLARSNNLECEFCGKTFRQLSYLATHKLQHKNEQRKKLEAKLTIKLQVFSCEVCKKEFRKLHHLVQHRIIHNPDVPMRTTRKCSSEQSDSKVKEPAAPKQNISDDTSAGFRCEPCDKSFRKLHHLVEHRETHDGINRLKTTSQTVAQPIEKPLPPPQCDICKKTFRKLHHLIEHKEQHRVEQVETSSEKSDDKSVQSSLSTRDIIHECSLCYMVFPNEHSLNKHFLFCQQKKKRQSKAKVKTENTDEIDTVEESTNTEDSMDVEDAPIIVEDVIDDHKVVTVDESKSDAAESDVNKTDMPSDTEKISDTEKHIEVSMIPVPKETIDIELTNTPAKQDLPKSDDIPAVKKETPDKIKKLDEKVKTQVLPKKSTNDKVAPSVTKRQKNPRPLPDPTDNNDETNNDDEIRYMLNPNFKADEISQASFFKVRSNKRNSLQIERPNSREKMSRKLSLQHPPKIPRLKAKPVEPKNVPTKSIPKLAKSKAEPADSDDSDVKYAFPETIAQSEMTKTIKGKISRKPLTEKRKSLSGIAKRKSLGKAIAKPKVNTPVKVIKRRTLDVEHRCDCGQLFNSAALLTRHTSLAHTPPRIRRRRSPPPDSDAKPSQAKTTAEQTTKSSRKLLARSEPTTSTNAKPTRKSSVKSDVSDTRKSIKQEASDNKKTPLKPKRNAAHRGVPVPEKMKKLLMKIASKGGYSNA